jgi:hypothetical protein
MRVDSDVDLDLPAYDASRAPVRRLAVRQLANFDRPQSPPLWTSRVSGYSLHEHMEGALVLVNQTGAFRIASDEIGVHFDPFTAEARNYLLGAAMALWLELAGVPVLHAACVADGENAAGLLGHSTTGKSTLTAGLVAAGYHFVSDDLLPLDVHEGVFQIYPSKPSTRLWPDAARHFVGDPEQLARVASSTEKRIVSASTLREAETETEADRSGPHRLRALYVLERTREATDVSVESLGPRDAFLAIVALSFAGEIVERLPIRASRLESVARAAREIPVRQLRYPSGFDHVPKVCDALVEDLRGLTR